MNSKESFSAAIISLILILVVALLGVTGGANAVQMPGSVENAKLRMSFDGGEVVVSLYDTPASRELVTMLPLTLSFEDYASTEKVAYLPRKLSSGDSNSTLPPGDFTYYAPWGNLAIFYKGYGQASGLYALGRIESGKKLLAGLKGNFTAKIELQ
jgi:Uncharacterized conserved protein